MEQYGCVLLKGGKSNRMGGSDKAKLLYRGKSFEERIKDGTFSNLISQAPNFG